MFIIFVNSLNKKIVITNFEFVIANEVRLKPAFGEKQLRLVG